MAAVERLVWYRGGTYWGSYVPSSVTMGMSSPASSAVQSSFWSITYLCNLAHKLIHLTIQILSFISLSCTINSLNECHLDFRTPMACSLVTWQHVYPNCPHSSQILEIHDPTAHTTCSDRRFSYSDVEVHSLCATRIHSASASCLDLPVNPKSTTGPLSLISCPLQSLQSLLQGPPSLPMSRVADCLELLS